MARVSQADIDLQLDRIEALIRRHPDGVAALALLEEYIQEHGKLTYRTLARRLEALASLDRIRSEGAARATRYYPKHAVDGAGDRHTGGPGATSERPGNETDADYVPLTTEAEEVRALIRRPLSARQPVGYNEEFFDKYVPGNTWYLPEIMRERLHELGRTPDAERPAGTFARGIIERLLIDLAWASSRLEGNTYTRLDTQNLLENGVRAEGKDPRDALMILNHKRAIELLVEGAEEVGFNRYTFSNLHAALSQDLLNDPRAEGAIRNRVVYISGTVYTPLANPHKLEELFDAILAKAAAIPDPFEQAFFVMVHIPCLQPFEDVNKRTSRLGANLPLIKANLCPLSFVGVPERAYIDGTLAVYEQNRVELLRDVFMWAYQRSCEQYRIVRDAMGEPDPLRLAYRTQLRQVVREMVQGGRPVRMTALLHWAESNGVSPGDQNAFAEAAYDDLLNLHEGKIYRYGLRPSEYQQWKSLLSATA